MFVRSEPIGGHWRASASRWRPTARARPPVAVLTGHGCQAQSAFAGWIAITDAKAARRYRSPAAGGATRCPVASARGPLRRPRARRRGRRRDRSLARGVRRTACAGAEHEPVGPHGMDDDDLPQTDGVRERGDVGREIASVIARGGTVCVAVAPLRQGRRSRGTPAGSPCST